jgi:hypothetical protein
LKIIHTDICRPFDATSFSKEKYFITFIDDYLCHGYVYLLHEKSQAIDALKVFINEVERQINMKVRFIKSDRGGEYYKRFNDTGQSSGSFVKFLKKHDIYAQYTMLDTPQQNGVAERCNCTLLDMVRSMLNY